MFNGLIKLTKFDLNLKIKTPYINKYKLNYRVREFLIQLNRLIQLHINPDFVFGQLRDVDYCHNCSYVFGKTKEDKDLRKFVGSLAYCVDCPDHRNSEITRAFRIAFKTLRGKYTYTEGQWRYQQDFASKNAKDLLQPTKYNNVTRKIETNKDYVKAYGKPFQDTKIGSEVEKDFESGEAQFIGDDKEIDPTEFI